MTTQHTALPHAHPSDVDLCPERTQRLMDVLRHEVASSRLPGAVAMVARRGQIGLFEAVGQQDPGTGVPMKTDSIFRIYSMTKPVVSVAVMMLVERGQLLLSDPVSRWLPEYANQQVATASGLEPVKQAATVQDLLRHTAGLTYEFLGDSAVQRQYGAVKIASRERTNAEFSQTLAALPLQFQPGTVWAYSRATDVLGRLLEVVTGMPLGQHLQQAIFEPLGMAVDALELTGRGGWRATLDTGAALELGGGTQQEVVQRTQRFISTLTGVAAQYQRRADALESADLRHAGGYALRLRGVTTVTAEAAAKK